ncbi:terminase family protein [Kiloniella laminariae]|uniref:Terminase family protein n=1 Tax=Kiloniella laminariae TaxID=454162 RepID=A0ABT4LKT9_9PROT|nr:terminase family protein [Kiloniella laminariae]MCZ4281718.1 terminase family protein [Kiloniella laminariae]
MTEKTRSPDQNPDQNVVAHNARIQARTLYWQGYTIMEISKALNLAYPTVDSWKRRDKWDEATVAVQVEANIHLRVNQLIMKAEKSEGDYREIDNLTKVLERTARIVRYAEGGKESDLNPKIKNRNSGKKKKPDETKNALSEEQVEALVTDFDKNLFGHQRKWRRARKKYRLRNILKSRQIGATWYFAREAFVDAITTGDNQIFLSASKAQAHVFKEYIIQWVKEVCDVTLRGDPIKLWNGATLYFLGTNSRTAQSYHGHLYMDEYFWIPRFAEFRKVASGMAVHKKWTQTYFSTPSTIGHQAYPFWSGEAWNKGKDQADKVQIDISHTALKSGVLCDDGQWRQIVTVEDAAQAGCDLFDLVSLKLEYNEHDYQNLFMCQFVDDHVSFFKMSQLEKCMVDTWTAWRDVDFTSLRPYGDLPVWIGYDPSRFKDDASVVVIAPPAVPGGKYRILERVKWKDTDFETQANGIKRLTEKYNVVHIGIDTSTIGLGVFELVQKFFPRAVSISYSVEVKNRLVLKAYQVISRRRLEFDSGWSDLAMAFMTIRKTATASGRQTTFQASRTSETGHADEAWAVMHALQAEGITAIDEPGDNPVSFMEIFDGND